MAPNNFGSAHSKAALKGPLKGSLKGPLKAVIGRLQLISWTSCGVIPLLYNITLQKIGEVAFFVVILLSYYRNTKWLKSFSVPSLGFQHILNRLPLLQGSLPKNKWTIGNNFCRPTCQWHSNLPSSSKTPVSWKQKLTCKDLITTPNGWSHFRCQV